MAGPRKRRFVMSFGNPVATVAVALLVGCGGDSEPGPDPALQAEQTQAAVHSTPTVPPAKSPGGATTALSNLPPLSEAIPESSHRFHLQIKGDVTTKIQQAPELALVANTVIQYQWKRKGATQQLFLTSQQVTAEMNGQLAMDMSMGRDRFSVRNQEGLTDVAFEEATPKQQQMLIDSYEKPLCEIRIDGFGRELERSVSTNAGAKDAIANGIVENARICHPPFPGTDTWEAPCAISMGNGNFTRGDLRYQVVGDRSESDTVHAEVAGQLTGRGRQGVLEIRNAVHAVRGSQVYDVAKREWTSADLHIDVGFDLYQDAKKVGHASGTMKLTMNIQDAAPAEPD